MFSGNKNKSGRKKLKPLYLAEGGFSLTPPGSAGTNPKTKTTVPFPQSAKEYMTTIGANPKYKNLDSSKILQLYSKDKSSWPKSLDIIEEDCSQPGTCGKTLKYSVTPTAPVYNWNNNKSATVTPKATPTTPKVTPTVVSKKPTLIPPPAPTVVPVTPPVQVTPKVTPQPTAPGNTSLMQRWQYMNPQDKARALQVYGSVDKIPTQGANIYELRKKVPNVSNFKSGGQTKNDKAMVSGVSSILRKIKDKDNRKEVAGDMVNQFNREGVNYNKQKFLKNSRSFATGGPVKPIYTSNPNDSRVRNYRDSMTAFNNVNIYNQKMKNLVNQTIKKGATTKYDPYYTTGFFSDHGFGSRKKAKDVSTDFGFEQNKLLNKYVNDLRYDPTTLRENRLYFHYPPIFLGGELYNRTTYPYKDITFPKPKQPVIYKPAPKKSTMTTMSKTPNKKTTTTSTAFTTPKTTTSKVETSPTITTPTTTATTTLTTPNTTSTVQTPRQLPANTPQMQRYNNMSTEDKKRAVKKYGDPSKVPFQGVDVNQLRKEVPTFKKGGQHGGLDRWFAEKWVDVKSGKPCGRQEGENRAYPACRPSKRISSKTPKTSSELSSKEKARFKSTKTSSQRIPYNHKRK